MISLTRRILVVTLALAPLGCAVGPDFKKPEPRVPTGWSASAASNAVNSDPPNVVDWWGTFQGPTLWSLVEGRTQSNLDLVAGVLGITRARAKREVAGGAFFPSESENG